MSSRQALCSGDAVVHPNYILVYQVTHCIDVVDVLHARQEYP